MRINENLGMILLSIWLIIEGIVQLTAFSGIGILLGLLALAAGIILLLSHVNVSRRRR